VTFERVGAKRWQVRILAAVLATQALAAVFFMADVSRDLQWGGLTAHSGLEALVAVALVVGTMFGAVQMRRMLQQLRYAETGILAASGAFFEFIEAQFRDWRLTPAETDVALLTLKGLDISEIAAVRGAAEGTVRAQLASVYGKARVSNRGQFVSLFIEDLLQRPPVVTDGGKPNRGTA